MYVHCYLVLFVILMLSYDITPHPASFLQRSAVNSALSRHRDRSSAAAQRGRSTRLHAVQKDVFTIIEVVRQARTLGSFDSCEPRHLFFKKYKCIGGTWWAGIPHPCTSPDTGSQLVWYKPRPFHMQYNHVCF